MEFAVEIEKHCSTCKHFYCYNTSMYCSHPTMCRKITAGRKNGCKYWENGINKKYF